MIIYAPNIVNVDGPVIFLAGPIQGAPRWQDKAINLISQHDGIHVASPRRALDRKQQGSFSDEMYNDQVDWETRYLRRAAVNGVILFWLANEVEHVCDRAFAQTSRFELGEWKERHLRDGSKLVVGADHNFSNRRYIVRRFLQDCPDITIHSSLPSTCEAAIQLATS